VSERIVAVTAPVDLFADVNGQHVRVVALAIVRLEETIDGEPEVWDVIQGVVSGAASELGLVDLADCHPVEECPAHAGATAAATATFRRRTRSLAA